MSTITNKDPTVTDQITIDDNQLQIASRSTIDKAEDQDSSDIGFVPIANNCSITLKIALPVSIKEKVFVVTTQCFGYTKSKTRCNNKKRKLIDGHCWCHWHEDQLSLHSAFQAKFLSDHAFVPSWW